MGLDSLPSSSFAMTMPLPALAEKRKPALKMVNIAKPLAFSSTLRGMTYAPFDANEYMSDLKKVQKTHPVEPIVPTVDKRLDCAGGQAAEAAWTWKQTYIFALPWRIPWAGAGEAVC